MVCPPLVTGGALDGCNNDDDNNARWPERGTIKLFVAGEETEERNRRPVVSIRVCGRAKLIYLAHMTLTFKYMTHVCVCVEHTRFLLGVSHVSYDIH